MTERFHLCRLAAALILLCSGCARNAAVEATTVLNYNQCQGLEAGLTMVDYDDVAGIRGGTLLGMTGAADSQGEDSSTDLVLVAISRGEQPTPGYGFTLEDTQRENGTAVVSISWKAPEAGSVLAQMTTHPCLVVGLPRNGIRRVEAVDQSGASLGSLEL